MIRYQPVRQFEMDLLLAEYKGIRMTLAEFPDAVSIYSCESKNQGKGEVQEMILELKNKYKKIYGSIPLNETMKHIFDKMGVLYNSDDR